MRRLIRSFKTGYYFSQGSWVADAGLADDFPDTLTAVRLTIEQHLPNVEIVLQLGERPSPMYDVRLPVARSRV
jgi:hypothetical protein